MDRNNSDYYGASEKIPGGAMSEPQAEIGCVLVFLFSIFPGSAIIGYMIGIPVLRIIYPHFGTWYDTLSEPALSFWHAPMSIAMVVGVATMIVLMGIWVIICLIWDKLDSKGENHGHHS